MSRSIQPGDLVKVSLGLDQAQYIIGKISLDGIDIYPQNNQTAISRLIPTSLGWKIQGAEHIPFKLSFLPAPSPIHTLPSPPAPSPIHTFPSPPAPSPIHTLPSPPAPITDLSVRDFFTPQLDLSSLYKPFPRISFFDFRSVKDWIDNQDVRINLAQESKIRLALFPFSDRYNQNIDIELNSPYRDEAQQYILDKILPKYVETEGPLTTQDGYIESDLTKQLIKAAYGALTLSSRDVYRVFLQIFPFLNIGITPSDGDCYYTAVGTTLGKDKINVRKDLTTAYQNLPLEDKQRIVANSLDSCPSNTRLRMLYDQDRDKFIHDFPEILAYSCSNGKGGDCEDCLWGGNHLDELLHLIYSKNIVSVGVIDEVQDDEYISYPIDEEGEENEVVIDILNEIEPGFWHPENLGDLDYLDDQSMSFEIINKIITVTSDGDQDSAINSSNFIAYINIAGKHVDAIFPKV